MSATYVSVELRRLVVTRAEGICEYCLMAEEDTFFGCEVDHIISEKHGGPTSADNLAYACVVCNQSKGSDVASIDWENGDLVRLFHPRIDKWSAHFRIGKDLMLEGNTAIGRVTISLLELNRSDRILERQVLLGRYPSATAKKRMK